MILLENKIKEPPNFLLFQNYFEHLQESLEGVQPANIFNYDETNLADDPKRQKVLFPRRVYKGNARLEMEIEHSKQNFRYINHFSNNLM